MSDLIFNSNTELNLAGKLQLAATNGTVKVGSNEVLVVVGKDGTVQGTGIPVILPPPPATPTDEATDVRVIQSFNSDVKVKVGSHYLPVVAMGITIQGSKPKGPTWPGIVLQSTNNLTVKINQIAINVKDDSAITLPNAGSVTFNKSGQ